MKRIAVLLAEGRTIDRAGFFIDLPVSLCLT
jgi:hypothetical protein